MPGASSGGGAGGGRVLFSPLLCSVQASGDRLVPPNMGEATYFPAPTSPGNTTPPAAPEVTAHLAGHAGEHGPRFMGRAAMVPIGRPLSCV